jgi:hypothetical protein
MISVRLSVPFERDGKVIDKDFELCPQGINRLHSLTRLLELQISPSEFSWWQKGRAARFKCQSKRFDGFLEILFRRFA